MLREYAQASRVDIVLLVCTITFFAYHIIHLPGLWPALNALMNAYTSKLAIIVAFTP